MEKSFRKLVLAACVYGITILCGNVSAEPIFNARYTYKFICFDSANILPKHVVGRDKFGFPSPKPVRTA